MSRGRTLARAILTACIAVGLGATAAQAGGHMRVAVGVLPIGIGLQRSPYQGISLPATIQRQALYDTLTAKGAVWGQGFGLEHALWFADGPEDAHEQPTFRRPRAHAYVAREVKAVREAVGALEIANFSKHSVSGPGAPAVPRPG